MPHCIIEYSQHKQDESQNHFEAIKVIGDSDSFLEDLHQLFCNDGELKEVNFKTRLIPTKHFRVGKGDQSFLALTLKILPGRSSSWKKNKGQELINFLKMNTEADKISVEILELEKEFYFKT